MRERTNVGMKNKLAVAIGHSACWKVGRLRDTGVSNDQVLYKGAMFTMWGFTFLRGQGVTRDFHRRMT